MATTLTREQRREISDKGTPEAKALLQANSNLDFAQKKLAQERDEFGTVGAPLAHWEKYLADKTEAYNVALAAYQATLETT